MKKTSGIILGILVSAATVFAANQKGEKAELTIDKSVSKVQWTAKKVTGEHSGHVSLGNGTVYVENSNLVGAQVVMDMNSIVCTDLTDKEWNAKLVGHLKSDDFFSVEKFPKASLEITSVKPAPTKGDYNVIGKLTIKGITNEISFPAKVNISGGSLKATGTAKLDRTKWDIRYGSGKFFEGLGDRMIYDEFEIAFDIAAKNDNAKLSKN